MVFFMCNHHKHDATRVILVKGNKERDLIRKLGTQKPEVLVSRGWGKKRKRRRFETLNNIISNHFSNFRPVLEFVSVIN